MRLPDFSPQSIVDLQGILSGPRGVGGDSQIKGARQLRCLTPEMVWKEVAMHFIGYNVLRRTITEVARRQDMTPGQISFKGALQTFKAFREEGLLMDLRRVECFATFAIRV